MISTADATPKICKRTGIDGKINGVDGQYGQDNSRPPRSFIVLNDKPHHLPRKPKHHQTDSNEDCASCHEWPSPPPFRLALIRNHAYNRLHADAG